MNKDDIFIQGQHVSLRVLGTEDARNTGRHGWFNDEETTFHLQKHYRPNTRENQVQFLEDSISDESLIILGVVTPDGLLIGVVSIQEIDLINRNGEISLVIGDPAYRSLVYAQEAMKLIIEHGFATLNLHKLSVGYVDSLADWGKFLMRRFGFQAECVWREHAYKNGEYVDCHQLGFKKVRRCS